MFKRAILTHGGAGSDPTDSDGPLASANIGIELMVKGGSALDAVIQSVKYMEDDPRFNAGIGSRIRTDNRTIQMDAACMRDDGKFGAVACVEDVQNPVEIAKEVLLNSNHILLAGEGARIFALDHNIPINALPPHNTLSSIDNPSCDTVGAVAFDGVTFAAALSSGGITGSAIGRVGDVPLPGCGLFCGPKGAIACTGDGEFIALKILAKKVYDWIELGMTPSNAAEKAIALFDDEVDIGLIILTKTDFALKARNKMASSHLTEVKKP